MHSSRAETAVGLRLRSNCRTCKPLHGVAGDRMRMATRKGSQVTRGTFAEAAAQEKRHTEPERARGGRGWTTRKKVTVHKAQSPSTKRESNGQSPAGSSSLGGTEKP